MRWAERNANLPLAFAAYEVVTRYQKATGDSPGGAYFNKLMSVLHRTLKAEGRDLRLPHCWYRYGDEVVRSWMPSPIVWDQESPQVTSVSWLGQAPDCAPNVAKEISIHVDKLTAQYAGEGGLERAIADVYSYAPFDFQREFRHLRTLFRETRNAAQPLASLGPTVLAPQAERAFRAFPSREFPGVAAYADEVASVVVHLLRDRPRELQLTNEIAEKFWEFFCYHLRLHPNGHENVPPEALQIWEETLPSEKQRFEIVLGGHLAQAAELLPDIVRQAGVASRIRHPETADAEFERLLAEVSPALEGLGEFSERAKRGYNPPEPGS